MLFVNDAAGKRLVDAMLAIQKVDAELYNFEFRIRRDLLAKSEIIVSARPSGDLVFARFALGTFYVRNTKK